MKTPCLKTGREFFVSGKMWGRFLSLQPTQIKKFYGFMDYLCRRFQNGKRNKVLF